VHPTVGGSPYGRNKWSGSTFTGRHWSDLTAAERRQTEAGTLLLLRKHGWNIGGNHNMGSQAARIVLETLAEGERQPDITVKNMLGRNALDHNLIWDTTTIGLARQLARNVAFGLNSELWNPRVVRGEEMIHVQYGDRLDRMQPVKDLVAAGIAVHFEGGDPEEPPMWRIERFVTRSDRFETRTERRRTGVKPASPRIWGADQKVDRRQALRMVTIDAARFISEEQMLGSIERGKYADLVVLSGNFLTVSDDQLGQLESVMTIVGGNVVYEAPGR